MNTHTSTGAGAEPDRNAPLNNAPWVDMFGRDRNRHPRKVSPQDETDEEIAQDLFDKGCYPTPEAALLEVRDAREAMMSGVGFIA